MKPTHFIPMMLVMALMQGCGFAHVRTNVALPKIKSYSYADLGKIVVKSYEQNGDLQGLNRELEAFVASELEQLLSRNGLRRPAAGDRPVEMLAFNVDVDIVYGNRGLRYLSGGIGRAGQGRVATVLRVTDAATGETQYQSVSESNLNLGLFGGSMRLTIEENIQKLMNAYPK
jgi:hypothetical protein